MIATITEQANVWYQRASHEALPDGDEGLPRRLRFTRVAFEQAFPDSFREAPAIEFRDGMARVSEVVAAVPEGFRGVLDLSLCNSTFLGAAVNRAHRPCRVVFDEGEIFSDVSFARYQLIIEELALAKEAISFPAALRKVHGLMEQEL